MSLARVFGIWCVLAVLMSANGILRETVLKPVVGGRSADVLSTVFGIAIILATTWIGWRPLAGASISRLTLVSVALVVPTIAFEFLLGHYLDHKSWSDLADNYAFWRGRLWPVVLLSLALSPFLWGRWFVHDASRS